MGLVDAAAHVFLLGPVFLPRLRSRRHCRPLMMSWSFPRAWPPSLPAGATNNGARRPHLGSSFFRRKVSRVTDTPLRPKASCRRTQRFRADTGECCRRCCCCRRDFRHLCPRRYGRHIGCPLSSAHQQQSCSCLSSFPRRFRRHNSGIGHKRSTKKCTGHFCTGTCPYGSQLSLSCTCSSAQSIRKCPPHNDYADLEPDNLGSTSKACRASSF